MGTSYQMDAFQQLCRLKGLEKSTIYLGPEVWDGSLFVRAQRLRKGQMLIIDQKTFKALRPPAHKIKSVLWLCCWWLMLLWADKKDIHSIFFSRGTVLAALCTFLSYDFKLFIELIFMTVACLCCNSVLVFSLNESHHSFTNMFNLLLIYYISYFQIARLCITQLDLLLSVCLCEAKAFMNDLTSAYYISLKSHCLSASPPWFQGCSLACVVFFPWSKRYPDCPPTWLSWEQVPHDLKWDKLWMREDWLSGGRQSPLSIHLTWLPRKQGCETGSWEEM